jgi:hypothetical protein
LLLQAAIVPAAPAVHSELAQQLGRALATQRFVPAQLRKLPLQLMPHAVPLHVAVPLAGGEHAWQVDPQALTSFGLQKPLQLRVLATVHVPPHAMLLSMQTPWQMYWLELVQTGMQLTPSQLTVPPVGAVQAGPHDNVPQVLTSLLLTHLLPHTW